MLRFYGKNQLVGIAAASTLNSDVYTTSGANSFHEADRCQGTLHFLLPVSLLYELRFLQNDATGMAQQVAWAAG
jgi:hypothetical protein